MNDPEEAKDFPVESSSFPVESSSFPAESSSFPAESSGFPTESSSPAESSSPFEPASHLNSTSATYAAELAHTRSSEYTITYTDEYTNVFSNYDKTSPDTHQNNDYLTGNLNEHVYTYADKLKVEQTNTYARELITNRGLASFIFLSIITLGIYPIVFWSGLSKDIDLIAGNYDRKKTMHYCLLFFLVGPLTLGLAYLVWHYKLSARMGTELKRRHIHYDVKFGSGSFWIWLVLCSLILASPLVFAYFFSVGSLLLFSILGSLIIVGPLVYTYKAAKAMNVLANNYNING
ncbi:MAG: DUF4234 domain-containing protein [Peptococcaceae bacterium]|nr:DUF4234 domain-containing protein [Peptococcaceae bacterium]